MPHSAPAQRLLVLTYHRIGDPAGAPPGMVSASPRGFERQMRWLGTSGRAVSLDQVLAARAGTASLPPGAVLVTFDDAYADFRERAWPVLRRHAVPVTLFVPTAFPGRPGAIFWWDRLYAAVAGARGSLDTEAGNFRLRGEISQERLPAPPRSRQGASARCRDGVRRRACRASQRAAAQRACAFVG
jgi:Polysaccharide deacetylase